MKSPSVQCIIPGLSNNIMKLTSRTLFPLHRWGNHSLKKALSQPKLYSSPRETHTLSFLKEVLSEYSSSNTYRPCLFDISGLELSRALDSVMGEKMVYVKSCSSSVTLMTPKRIIMAIIHQKKRSDNYKNGICSYHLASQHELWHLYFPMGAYMREAQSGGETNTIIRTSAFIHSAIQRKWKGDSS